MDVDGAISLPEVMRRVAMLLDVPIQEILTAAGYMTEEENRPMNTKTMSLRQFSTIELLDERAEMVADH